MRERWNDNMKVVIVGGVAGGATAAARIRRLNEQAEIVVFERSGYISYANCGLPYYIGDVITEQSQKQLMMPFDSDMAAFIHAEVRKHGIHLALGHKVEGFTEKDGGVDVLLSDGTSLHGDMAVLAIGVTPDTHLAKEAGLELGVRGSIVVNDRMETSVPDIYAAGDAVQVKHFVTDEDTLISLAGPANKQGRIIADNICGGDSRYMGSQGSSVIKVFDLTAASTGINETHAKNAGLNADTVILSPMSHAGYYPGGKVMTMKVVFEKGNLPPVGRTDRGLRGRR